MQGHSPKCEVPKVEGIEVKWDGAAAHASSVLTAVGANRDKRIVSSTHIDDRSVQHPCSSAWDAQ